MASNSEQSYFDLNIGQILETWMPRHAVREVIANALDEQILSRTAEVIITKEGDTWSVRDFGRGLRPEHLKQDENAEKLANANRVIGRFGFGLKDALATLHRHKVETKIMSPHGDIEIVERQKHGFKDMTLHAAIRPAADPGGAGTVVQFRELPDGEMNAAKALFLRFSGEEKLADTPYGQILKRKAGTPAHIYVKGVLVADEQDFAFSYNVTSLTAAMMKALNRERSHVGRTAYADRVKAMLLACTAECVAEDLAAEIAGIDKGTAHDEVKWTDVAVHACRILNAAKKVVFASSAELQECRDTVVHAATEGYSLVSLPANIREKLHGVRDPTGAPVKGLDVFAKEWSDSFKFNIVPREQLTKAEKGVFARRGEIAALAGGWPPTRPEVVVTQTMRPDANGRSDAAGLWEPKKNQIIMKRDQLASLHVFAGTLLHEIVHAKTGHNDVSRDFEEALSGLLGAVAEKALVGSVVREGKNTKRASRTKSTATAGKGRKRPKRSRQGR